MASVAEPKTPVPAIEGWFTMEDEPRLLGTRCSSCGTYFFPRVETYCANPACDGTDLNEVPLSRAGRLWSYTENHYPPPAPYVAAEPFEPFIVAAVELEAEKIVVLGQVVPGTGISELRVGMEMELAVGTLFEDDDHEYTVWKWKPAGRG